jgi:hypothetical protein
MLSRRVPCRAAVGGGIMLARRLLATTNQGLTLVQFPAQREHLLSHVMGFFDGFSDKNGSG